MAKAKKKRVPKVRATKVNQILVSKKGGKHEDKHGPKAKRARRKQLDRKLKEDI